MQPLIVGNIGATVDALHQACLIVVAVPVAPIVVVQWIQ